MPRKNRRNRGSLHNSTNIGTTSNSDGFQRMQPYGKNVPPKSFPNSNRSSNPNFYGPHHLQNEQRPFGCDYSNTPNRAFNIASPQFPSLMDKQIGSNLNTPSLLPTPPLMRNPESNDRNCVFGASTGNSGQNSGNFAPSQVLNKFSQWPPQRENILDIDHYNNRVDNFARPIFEVGQNSDSYHQSESPQFGKQGLLGTHPKNTNTNVNFAKKGILPIPDKARHQLYGRDNFQDIGVTSSFMTRKRESLDLPRDVSGSSFSGHYTKEQFVSSERNFRNQVNDESYPSNSANFYNSQTKEKIDWDNKKGIIGYNDNYQSKDNPYGKREEFLQVYDEPSQKMRNEGEKFFERFSDIHSNENHKRKRPFSRSEEFFKEFNGPSNSYNSILPSENTQPHHSNLNFTSRSYEGNERNREFHQAAQNMLNILQGSDFGGGPYVQKAKNFSDNFSNQIEPRSSNTQPIGGTFEERASYQNAGQSLGSSRNLSDNFQGGSWRTASNMPIANYSKQSENQNVNAVPKRSFQELSDQNWNKFERDLPNSQGFQFSGSRDNRTGLNEFLAEKLTETEAEEDLRIHILRLKERKIEEQLEELKKKSRETDRKLCMLEGNSRM